MTWAGLAARMGEKRNTYRVLVGRSHVKTYVRWYVKVKGFSSP